MEDSLMSIKSLNLTKSDNSEVLITFTFLDDSQLILKTKFVDGKIVPLNQNDELIYSAIDPNIIMVINNLVQNMQ